MSVCFLCDSFADTYDPTAIVHDHGCPFARPVSGSRSPVPAQGSGNNATGSTSSSTSTRAPVVVDAGASSEGVSRPRRLTAPRCLP